jgi:hypothetical protein
MLQVVSLQQTKEIPGNKESSADASVSKWLLPKQLVLLANH